MRIIPLTQSHDGRFRGAGGSPAVRYGESGPAVRETSSLSGARQALRPHVEPRSLRAERIALGIDLPELDAAPLWSTRRADGKISIPFVEYLLGQIWVSLESFCAGIGPRGGGGS